MERHFRITAVSPARGRFATVFEDVTERKRTESERQSLLAESQRQAEESRALIRHAASAIFEIDFRGPRFTNVNDAMCEMTGYSREELLAADPFSLLDEQSRAAFEELLADTPAGESPPDEVDCRVFGKDGRELFAVLHTQFTLDTEGRPRSALVIGHDVTGSVRSEQRLQAELATTQALLEAARSTAALDLTTVLARLVGIIAERLGRSRVVIHLFENDRELRTLAATHLRVLHVGEVQRLDDYSPELQHATLAGTPTIVDFRRQGLSETALRERERLQVEVVLYVPVMLKEHLIGVVTIDEPRSSLPFGDRDVELASALAAQAAMAIENARLFEAEKAAADEATRRADRTGLLRELSDAAATAGGAAETARRQIASLTRALGPRTAALLILDETGERLVPAALEGFSAEYIERHFGPIDLDGEGLSAQVFRAGRPAFIRDVASDPSLSEGARAFNRSLGLGSGASLPLVGGRGAVGTLVLGWGGPKGFEPEEVSFLESVAAQIAAGIENARLFDAERAAQRRAEAELARTKLLQQVAVVATTSVSLGEVTDRVLQAIFEGMGLKVGTVYSYDQERQMLDLLAWHGMEEASDDFRTLAVDDDSPALVVKAVLGRSVVTTADFPLGEEGRRVLEAAGVSRSEGVALPIEYGGAVIGCCSFLFERDRAFDPEELELFRSLALILGQAIENARLYGEQKAIATTLQENFIHPLPVIDGLELAALSLPATSADLIGGDFHDVFELADGRIAIVIGDVAGKGIRAAGLTETVRSTVRAFAAVDPSPAFVLARANEQLLRADLAGPSVTVFLMVLDTRTGDALYASAGHPPAVHVRSSSSRPLDVTFGLPLGSFSHEYVNEQVRLSPDDYVLLYTDGVTEARRDGEEFGDERLCELAARLRGRSAQEMAEGVRDAAREFAGHLRDDLHVVCLRLA